MPEKKLRNSWVALAALAALAGCEKGTSSPDPSSPWLELDWASESKDAGKVSTTLPGGENCRGTYAREDTRIVAQLEGDKATQLRCVLNLDMPDVGIDGGGEGTCEGASGKPLRARLVVH